MSQVYTARRRTAQDHTQAAAPAAQERQAAPGLGADAQAFGMGSRLHTGLTAAFQGTTNGSVGMLPLTWSGNKAYLTSWDTALDFNRNGDTYHVFAFYAEEEA